ncbi:translocation/assembly module TamB domain-containing protein [Oryzomonas rubra]|uniref:Translocation/assembly module TamB n=1 Tax=Oryzomonas rubra TaxID=2509454 RepID=A0A5A9XDQ1_9BACT|nr:translocation/assembly module TamB domain-containing protein [Oryzomonas rubra]KAA0890369.1 translocation/assembly module TamB [Oryzomonas rubra]
MKRPTPKSLVAAVAITLAGAALAALVWVVATTEGARWLLGTAGSLSEGSFSVQKVEGRIADRLLLTGVRIGLSQQKLEFGSLELRWKPLLLLSGTVAIQELTASGVRIQDNTPPANKPPILAWPRVPQVAQQFDGIITRLQVTDLSYRRRQEQPVPVTSIAASVTWRDSLLAISDLTAAAPSGRISGVVSAGFRQPSLTADLAVAPAHRLAEMDRFLLKVGRGNGTGPEPFTGTVAITGTAGTRKLLELTGDVSMAHNAFNLRRVRLTSPGQKGLLTADGSLTFTARESALSLQVTAAGLDLAPQLNVPTNLSGTLRFAGGLDSYRGDVTLTNRAQGWRAASVSATYRGTRDGIKLAPLNARFLDGSLAGNLDMNWRDGFAMRGAINGRNLNPARIAPDWKGRANFNATGTLAWSGKAPLTGSVSGVLLESRLHGQALTGGVQAGFAENNLNLSRLALQGKGFDLHASGELNRRLAVTARITDLSRLVPGAAGTLQADGWVRWRERHLSGAVAGTGSKLVWHGARAAAATLIARLEEGAGYPLHASVSLRDAVYDGYALGAVTLNADGTLPHHAVSATLHSAGSEARLNLAAGYNSGVWMGEITRLAGRDRSGPWNLTAPATFAVSAEKFSLSPLALTAGTAERLEVASDLALNPLSGQVRAKWAGLNLARANPYLKDMQFTGNSNGTVRLGFLPGKRLTLAGSASGSGTFTGQGTSITVLRSQVTLDGSEQGVRAGMDLSTANGGRLKGVFSSSAPLRLAMPEKGELTAQLSGIDLALLKPWLPRDTVLAGHITGRMNGILLPGQRFELTGTAALSGGALHRTRPDGELNLTFNAAEASWNWRGATLAGTLALTMADHGQARANFQLPVPARFPVAVDPQGPLRASLTGQFQEKGIITALFPGLVQESSGELAAELAINGTWETPQIGGTLKLAKAGAYLPTAGVHLKDVQLAARLEKNLIRIDTFRAVSGPGHVEGTALLTLAGWRVVGYQGTITGENFQTVYFPELQILSTPKLTFTGTPQKITLRGELRLPELHIVGAPSRSAIAPSSDVIMEGRAVPVAKASPLVLDAQVRVLLGDKVFVKVAGIDAQLGGALDLSLTRLDSITSRGEIKVAKGRYRTYGVNLEIVRGRLFFAGGPINRPSLDFLALRTIGDVRAGVTVAGTLQKPVTKLYSEPAMPDVDVLAYIVLGHPLGSNSQQASLVAQAAGALLTSGQAGTLQEQIKNHLGLSTLEIQGGVGGTASPMGYKPLQVTPPGTIPATQQPGVTETMLTVGKYLTPQLYISYGKSLFTGSNLFLLRYDIFKQWQIETQTGTESGADLFYKLEFK